MKKAMNYTAVLLAAAVTFLSSCKKTEDDPAPDSLVADVSLSMNETNGTGTDNEDFYVNYSDNAVLEVTAVTTTSSDMKRLYIYKEEDNGAKTNVGLSGFKTDGNNNYYYDIPNDSKNNFTLKREVTVSSNTSRVTDVYYFYFTDNSNFNVASPGSDLVIGPGTITLIYPDFKSKFSDKKLYNVCSSMAPGAYDLQNMANVTATVDGGGNITIGSGADMAQQTGVANCGTFNGWVGQNSTAFVKSNSFDVANASTASVTAAYAAGTPTSTVTGVAVGDIYIAKLKGTTEYAVIKVTGVSSIAGNDDFYTFDVYKKPVI